MKREIHRRKFLQAIAFGSGTITILQDKDQPPMTGTIAGLHLNTIGK
ncbi:MAG: hypothetical protein O7C75_17885 [Verrucomicrobia bacterium]|nr:hypothetical protein [Verrucomicrobiota bacterium]